MCPTRIFAEWATFSTLLLSLEMSVCRKGFSGDVEKLSPWTCHVKSLVSDRLSNQCTKSVSSEDKQPVSEYKNVRFYLVTNFLPFDYHPLMEYKMIENRIPSNVFLKTLMKFNLISLQTQLKSICQINWCNLVNKIKIFTS